MSQRVTMPTSEHPIPVASFDNHGFWEGCRQHELRLQRCRTCHTFRHQPRPMCPQCRSLDYEWARASGRGTVYTFTIVHGPTLPAFQAAAPYNVIVVQLEEGPFMVSNLVDCGAEHIRIGMAVEVVFEDVTETATLPRFRPLA
jgi:hypothetical protein